MARTEQNSGLAQRLCAYVLVVVLAVASDLASKAFMQKMLAQGAVEIIPDWFYFRFAWNPGIAFGMLQSGQDILLVLIPILLLGILLYSWQYRHEHLSHLLCLAAILGGAVGNYVDRMFFGRVRDFIDVKFGGWYDYPIFNLADAYISCGAVFLILTSLWQGWRQRARPAA